MKRRLLLAAVITICLSMAAYGTLAFFTAEDTAHNVITSGGVDIDLLEWADEEKTVPFPEEGADGVMPGSEVTKIVEVKNTGASDAYIRVKVEKEIVLSPDAEGEPDTGLIVLDFDENNWIEKDGYYYYKKILSPGDVTEPLFASVSFDASMDNLYQNSNVTVDVTAYAVQSANNGESATEARGWPEA